MTQPRAATHAAEVRRRTIEVIGLTPLILALVAEAAWIAVLAGLAQEYFLRAPVLDMPLLAVCVVIGVATSQLLGLRMGNRWPIVVLGLTLVTVVVGVFVAPDAREAVSRGGMDGLSQALAANPGGILAGLAFLRGVSWARAELPLAEDRVVRLLTGGLIVIALAAVAGSLVAEPWRGQFLGNALGQGLTFGACAIVALALTRQAIAVGGTEQVWQRNPVWLSALVLLVACTTGLALAAHGQIRPAFEIIIGAAAVPILIFGLIGGWTRRVVRDFFLILGAFVIGTAIASALLRLRDTLGSASGAAGGGGGPSLVPVATNVGVTAVVALIAMVVVIILVRIWMRQLRIEPTDPVEERYVDRTADTNPRPSRPRRLPFYRQPADAVSAYRALIADLAERRGVRREASETPREHAARLRADEGSGLALDLLAADYALASFGDVHLSAGENRRAVRRWRLLRRSLKPSAEPDESAR